MRTAFSVALVLVLFTRPLSAQNFGSESAWRDAMQKTTEDTIAAKHYKLWGGVIASAGGALTATALATPHKLYWCNYLLGCSGIYNTTPNWGLLAPAIGAVSGGAGIFIWGLHKSDKANDELHRLQQYGSDKGWQVQLGPAFRVTYRW